jgi:hypothetical protein
MLFKWLLDLLEQQVGLIPNRSERRHHCLVRRVHKFSSIC